MTNVRHRTKTCPLLKSYTNQSIYVDAWNNLGLLSQAYSNTREPLGCCGGFFRPWQYVHWVSLVSAEAGFDSSAQLLHTWTKNIQELYLPDFQRGLLFLFGFFANCRLTEGSAVEKVHTAWPGRLGIACQLYMPGTSLANCSYLRMQISRNVLHHLTLDSKLSPSYQIIPPCTIESLLRIAVRTHTHTHVRAASWKWIQPKTDLLHITKPLLTLSFRSLCSFSAAGRAA